MTSWEWVIDVIGLLVAAAVLVLVALIVRRRLLARGGGTFELSINRRPHAPEINPGRGWTLGVGRYTGERLEWFRVFSLSVRPQLVLERGKVEVSGRREPIGPEAFALYSGNVIAECRTREGTVQLGLSPESLTGLLAWLESRPPGGGTGKVV